MADTIVTRTVINGYKNVVIRCTGVSDGTGEVLTKIYDASATGTFGVSKQGQTFYPGIHSKLVYLDYDIQDVKLELYWEATPNELLFALGNAPEDFSWLRHAGLTVPPGLTGATGSLLLSTINPAPGSTWFLVLGLTKNVPVS